MSTPAERILRLRRALSDLATAADRDPAAVTLIAVSKGHPTTAIKAAHAAGLEHFGENYLQEAIPKLEALAALPLTWHYLGRLQSNKTQAVAERFDWVHTADRAKIIERLARARRASSRSAALNICLQVNIDADPRKGGVAVAEVKELAEYAAGCDGVVCRGLMTILDPAKKPEHSFAAMASLFEQHRTSFQWDTLSMGMSADYPAAVAAGATQVRIGTGIFGPRTLAPKA